ncbi:MAG: hypothetical protein ACK2TX_02170 [Anaerolineales bacterium]
MENVNAISKEEHLFGHIGSNAAPIEGYELEDWTDILAWVVLTAIAAAEGFMSRKGHAKTVD